MKVPRMRRIRAQSLAQATALSLGLGVGMLAICPSRALAAPDPSNPLYSELQQDLLLSCEDGANPIPISLQVMQYFGTKTDHLDRIGRTGCDYLDSGNGPQPTTGDWTPRGYELDNPSPTQTISETITDGVSVGTLAGFQFWYTFKIPFFNEMGPMYMHYTTDTKTFQVDTTVNAGPCEKVQMYVAPPMYQGSGVWVMHYGHAFDLGSYDGIGAKSHYEWHAVNFRIKGPAPDTGTPVMGQGGPRDRLQNNVLPPVGHIPGCVPRPGGAPRALMVPGK